MPNRQNAIGPFVCSASKMHSPFGMQECQASLFDEDTPGIRKFHNPSRIASEEVKLMLFFEVGNLFAEGRLSDVQSVRGPREVTLFGQDNDCVQVTDFEVGEHGSRPQAVKTSRLSHEVVRILIDFRTALLFLWLVARIQDRSRKRLERRVSEPTGERGFGVSSYDQQLGCIALPSGQEFRVALATRRWRSLSDATIRRPSICSENTTIPPRS
jgi:hypothetical protein